MSITTVTTAAPSAYAEGLAEGRTDAATTPPDVTTVRAGWIAAFADVEYAKGYRAGLHFDRDLQAVFTSRRRS